MKPDLSRTHHVTRILRRILLVGTLSAVLAACAVPDLVVRTPKEEVAKLPLIDVHSHYTGTPRRTAQEFIETMDAVGIGRMVLFMGESFTGGGNRASELQKYPERFVLSYTGPIANDTARAKIKSGDPNAVEELLADYERALKSGLYGGLGEIHAYHSDRPTQMAPDSPAIRGLLELATRYDVPINIHCNADGRVEMERALKAYPKATVIWAHTGTFLPPAAIMDLLRTHPNLYFDLAIKNKRLRSDGYPILFGMTLRDDWRQIFESYPDRFFVGFDFPGVGYFHGTRLETARESMEFIRAILMQLTPSTARKIAYENAQAMLPRGR
jgi:Predicted metal-dependent hydrolase of the TIM-barrel fold